MEIKIKYFGEERLEKIAIGDWVDLKSAINKKYNKGDFFLLPLGVAMKLPEGYEAHVAPRGSTFKHFKVIQTNSVGVIDESYCGDNDQWFVPFLAMEDGIIERGDRVCQFRIIPKMPRLHFTSVRVLEDADRGGHGSTGK